MCLRNQNNLIDFLLHKLPYSVKMTVETILTCILLTALRADDVSVLISEVNVFDVPLQ